MKKILVYDDEENLSRNYVERLRKLEIVSLNFKIDPLSLTDFEKGMVALEERRNNLRKKGTLDNESIDLDEASILIIDYDLVKSFASKSFLTGEEVAYLARCFSKCGLIIGLNQFGENAFDLTLKGHVESYCDLNIGSKQLTNLGLWGEKTEGFRPWYWPRLPSYLEAFYEKTKDVENHVNDPICDVLGFKEMIRTFPRGISEFIGGNPTKVTFSQFVKKSGNGLHLKDKNATEEMISRIAAARVSKWLERLILPGQDALVDAPHLVSRYPSLLKGGLTDIETWNKTAWLGSHRDLDLDHRKIEEFRFKKSCWLSRPAWFWRELSECRKIKEVSAPWEKKSTGFVFCEDSSKFHKREECKEFIAESDSPYVQRFVFGFEGIDYRPKVRLVASTKKSFHDTKE